MTPEAIFWTCWAAGFTFCLAMAVISNWIGTRSVSDDKRNKG